MLGIGLILLIDEKCSIFIYRRFIRSFRTSKIFPYLNKLSETDLSFFVCTIENKKNKNKLKNFLKKIKNNSSFKWNYFFFLKKRKVNLID